MQVHAHGATDVGNIVLFWPENLPDEADSKLKDGDIDFIEDLRDEGKMIWFLCEGDVDCNLAVFIDEAIPEYLFELCEDEEFYETLSPNGVGYFGGMEFMSKFNLQDIQDRPYLCEAVQLPEGEYRAWVYRTNISEHAEVVWLNHKVGKMALFLNNMEFGLGCISMLGILSALVSIWFVPWNVWFGIVISTAIAAAISRGLSSLKLVKSVHDARSEFTRLYPSYVVRLESKPEKSGP